MHLYQFATLNDTIIIDLYNRLKKNAGGAPPSLKDIYDLVNHDKYGQPRLDNMGQSVLITKQEILDVLGKCDLVD
jgi:hypothetical protein